MLNYIEETVWKVKRKIQEDEESDISEGETEVPKIESNFQYKKTVGNITFAVAKIDPSPETANVYAMLKKQHELMFGPFGTSFLAHPEIWNNSKLYAGKDYWDAGALTPEIKKIFVTKIMNNYAIYFEERGMIDKEKLEAMLLNWMTVDNLAILDTITDTVGEVYKAMYLAHQQLKEEFYVSYILDDEGDLVMAASTWIYGAPRRSQTKWKSAFLQYGIFRSTLSIWKNLYRGQKMPASLFVFHGFIVEAVENFLSKTNCRPLDAVLMCPMLAASTMLVLNLQEKDYKIYKNADRNPELNSYGITASGKQVPVHYTSNNRGPHYKVKEVDETQKLLDSKIITGADTFVVKPEAFQNYWNAFKK